MSKIDELWNRAASNPGTAVDIGSLVVCDFCSEDFSASSAEGGFIFQSNAVCPVCSPRIMDSVKRNGETCLIRRICPQGMSFAAFVRDYRGVNNSIVVHDVPRCGQCKQPFTEKNVHTSAGWAETRISGTCEDCFDRMFEEVDEE